MCQVSPQHVLAYLDGHGLTPQKDENGRVWYAKDEADIFAKTYKRKLPLRKPRVMSRLERRERGELCAKVFTLLDEGKSQAAIIVATKGDPDLVQEFMRYYRLGFEGREAEIAAQVAAQAERERMRALERQRQRDEHFAHKRAMARVAVKGSRFAGIGAGETS